MTTNSFSRFYVLGLTGGLASGKDTASAMLAAKGAQIIDSDVISREMTLDDSPATKEIIKHFGKKVVEKNGGLDRSALRSIVFNDPAELKWLEQLLHPLVREETIKQILAAQTKFRQAKNKQGLSTIPYCVLASPLLLDADQYRLCDFIATIDVKPELQIERATKRPKVTKEIASKIIAKQLSVEERKARSNYIIDNNSDMAALSLQLDKLHNSMLETTKAPAEGKLLSTDPNKALVKYRIMKYPDTDVDESFFGGFRHLQILSKLSRKYNFVYSKEAPDMIILVSHEGRAAVYKDILKIRKIYENRKMPFIIIITQEAKVAATDSARSLADYSFSYQEDSPRNTWAPHFCLPPSDMTLFDDLVKSTPKYAPVRILRKRYTPKGRFCAFVASRAPKYLSFTRQRLGFVRRLSQYKQVDCAGKLLNNTDELHSKYANNKLQFMSQYKFAIAFENARRPWYVTEKIYECFLAGAIPIYFGSPNVTKFYNSKAFINCADYASFDEVIERVKEIDGDDNLYKTYLAQPPFAVDSPLYKITSDKMVAKWDEIIANKVLGVRTNHPSKNTILWRVQHWDLELKSFILPLIRDYRN